MSHADHPYRPSAASFFPFRSAPVPLLANDPDVILDLQAAFTAAYDVPGYDLIVDYSEPPEVPLSDREAAWVQAHLQRVGLHE
jgi:hypothetical protein